MPRNYQVTMRTGTISVSSVGDATKIIDSNPNRLKLVLLPNSGNNTVRIGPDNTVTASSGFLLNSASPLEIDTNGEVWGHGGGVINFLEEST